MIKPKLKGLLLTATVLLALSVDTLKNVAFADDVDDVATTESAEKEEDNNEKDADNSEDDKVKDIDVTGEIEKIKNSNKSASYKAKELLNVYNTHLENQQKLSNEISVLKVQLDEKDLKLAEKSEELGKTEAKLKEKQEDLDKKKSEVSESEARLSEIKDEIEVLNTKISNKKEVMAERAKTLQLNMNSNSNKFLDIVLNAKNISDAVTKLFALNTLQEADNELRETLSSDVEELNSLEEEQSKILDAKKLEKKSIEDIVNNIEIEKDKLESDKKELEDNLNSLNKDKKEYDERTNKANEDIKTLSSELSSLTSGMSDLLDELDTIKEKLDKDKNKSEIAEIEKIKDEIKVLQENARLAEETRNSLNILGSNSGGIPTIVDKELYTKSQKKLIETAEKYLGVDYVWGGTAPNGLDCSGLTQRVYREAVGIEITRVTYTQQYQGKEVSLSDIQVGDLIFWGEPTYHVAIYAGNGYYIHAPKPGDVVRYSNYNLSGVSHIRRIIDYK